MLALTPQQRDLVLAALDLAAHTWENDGDAADDLAALGLVHDWLLERRHEPLVTGVFAWDSSSGVCHNCGLPAFFHVSADPYAAPNLRCALCAANAAAGGEAIRRIFPPDTDTFDLAHPPWTAPGYGGDSDKWGDEQDRSEWFEAAASYWATRALAAETRGPMAVSGSAIGWLATAQRVAELLNAGNSQLAALNAVGVSPDDAFSEDPALPFDDPDNAIVDLGWHDGACHYVQRGGDGRWTVQTRVSPTTELETHGR